MSERDEARAPDVYQTRRSRILRAVVRCQIKRDRSPTQREIASSTGYEERVIARDLVRMRKDGDLDWDAGEAKREYVVEPLLLSRVEREVYATTPGLEPAQPRNPRDCPHVAWLCKLVDSGDRRVVDGDRGEGREVEREAGVLDLDRERERVAAEAERERDGVALAELRKQRGLRWREG